MGGEVVGRIQHENNVVSEDILNRKGNDNLPDSPVVKSYCTVDPTIKGANVYSQANKDLVLHELRKHQWKWRGS